MIYEETNSEFEVSVESTDSFEYVFIKINSLFTPLTTETWFKHSKNEEGDFSLVSPMRYGASYNVKHSGSFFYKMTNEEDGINYKITKIPLPSKFMMIDDSNESSNIKKENENHLEKLKDNLMMLLPGDKSIELPQSEFFDNRENALEIRSKSDLQLLQPEEIVKTKFDAKILDFYVNQHYLCLLEERNGVEQLRTMTLKNKRWHTDAQLDDYYHISLEDNMTYNTQYLRYRLSTPHLPDRINEHNMGTHKTNTIHLDHYTNPRSPSSSREESMGEFSPENYQTEKIMVGDCPVVLSYNVNAYNENSPFLLHTLGSQSSKQDLAFDIGKASMMDRGIVYAYPMVRGTKYFDDDWYLSGLGLKRIERMSFLYEF